ncbi:MAG: pilus assembly protein [Alphaproteobacteria bacterium]|jgi:Flp pilus assembly protein TadG|nr:pilus assembly protein [Alphaproteobacteria bacterium]QQS56999.1 MAG: pilus assembly protein [Alphaproteobacteria bacterium]
MMKLLKLWKKKEDGATAIEFSLVAIPYFMLCLGIMELSLMYTSASLLEGATDSAARLVRTGQVQQTNGDPEQMFRDAMCNFVQVLIDCNDVVIEVQTMASYDDYESMAPVFDGDGNMVSQGFAPGDSNDRVLIRVGYRYEMVTPLVGPLLNGPDGGTLFMSTIVLQTEPYEFEDAGA